MATPTSLPAAQTTGNVLTAAYVNDLRGAFRVLKVVSTTKQDTFAASVASLASVDVTGLSATITPSATTSTILITVNMNGVTDVSGSIRPYITAQLKRGATLIGGGNVVGSRTTANMAGNGPTGTNDQTTCISFSFMDSPATTSATTYQVALFNAFGATFDLRVNRVGGDADVASTVRLSSTITVMEISA
jgi:hypothetical protein